MKIKLAIVDDNTFLIKAVKEKLAFFEDIDLKWIALDGAKCLEKLGENHNLDLILMDIEMPVLKGTEFLKNLAYLLMKKRDKDFYGK